MKNIFIILFVLLTNTLFSQITIRECYQRNYCEKDYCVSYNDTTEIKYQININFIKISFKNKMEGLKTFQFDNKPIASIKNSMGILSIIYQIDKENKLEFLYNKVGQLIQVTIINSIQIFTYIIIPNDDLFI